MLSGCIIMGGRIGCVAGGMGCVGGERGVAREGEGLDYRVM